MNEHEKRKDERGKDAQRKNEQTSMSKQQMSRNKGSRQEDDNKSKKCFDTIATGNPSINNSTPSTSSHSREKSSHTCMRPKIFVVKCYYYNFILSLILLMNV